MIIEIVKKLYNKKTWRKKNKHNSTVYNQVFGDSNNIHIGNFTYGEIYVSSPNTSNELYIGNFCSIAGEVRFLLGADHRLDSVSTFPFNTIISHNGIDAQSKGNIVVEDDVWIGQGCIILSGVRIGQGAVVAAGAVVSKDIPPYAIVGGVPAKIIKYRFCEEVIGYLMTLDYSKLTEEMVCNHIKDLDNNITNMNIKDIKKCYSWFPKK